MISATSWPGAQCYVQQTTEARGVWSVRPAITPGTPEAQTSGVLNTNQDVCAVVETREVMPSKGKESFPSVPHQFGSWTNRLGCRHLLLIFTSTHSGQNDPRPSLVPSRRINKLVG